MHYISYKDNIDNILEAFEESKFLVVDDFDAELPEMEFVKFCQNFGVLIENVTDESEFKKTNFDVIKPTRKNYQYSDGFEIRSTTRQSMLCHTDNFSVVKPLNMIAMLCLKEDVRVQSFFVSLKNVLAKLDSEVLAILSKKNIFLGTEFIAIISELDGISKIRFDLFELERLVNDGKLQRKSKAFLAALHLSDVIESCKKSLLLRKGQIVLLDNTEFLHGRSELPSDSNRTLVRTRIYHN